MSIGQQIDALYLLRSQRLVFEREVAEVKAKEAAAKQAIIDQLKLLSLEGARGDTATASITYKIKPNVTDWDAVWAYIRDNDMFALLQKRITASLWDALREDGILVPGTEEQPVVDLSLTKSKR